MTKQQTLEEKTISQQLKNAGVDEDIADIANCVASTISNFEIGGVRKKYILTIIAENQGCKDFSDFVKLQADVDDSLRVLEKYGFIGFDKGKYKLTDKGRQTYQ